MIQAVVWLWGAWKAVQGLALADGHPCPWCGRTGDVEALERRVRALETAR